jgi:hypothetical protein
VDLRKRQESHLLDCVMPYVTATLPVVNTKKGTFLVGFSKSGWGGVQSCPAAPRSVRGDCSLGCATHANQANPMGNAKHLWDAGKLR